MAYNVAMNDQHYMTKALALAKQAEQQGEVPVGALLVKDGEVVASGFNQPIGANDPSAHAEIVALRRAADKLGNYRLLETTLYVILEPCAMCVGAMIQARIKRLVFGAFDSRAGAVESVFQLLDEKRLNHHIDWQGGVMADECAAILQQFFQARRVKP